MLIYDYFLGIKLCLRQENNLFAYHPNILFFNLSGNLRD